MVIDCEDRTRATGKASSGVECDNPPRIRSTNIVTNQYPYSTVQSRRQIVRDITSFGGEKGEILSDQGGKDYTEVETPASVPAIPRRAPQPVQRLTPVPAPRAPLM